MDSETLELDGAAVSAPRLSEFAYQAMMGMLMSGELAPNEVVPERQIAAKLGISRTPLREATRRLVGERFLEQQKSGVVVVRPLPIDEFMHILNVRRVLEGEAARLAAGHVPKVELQRVRERIADFRALPDEPPLLPDYDDGDRDLHMLIGRASGNPVLLQLIEDLRRRTLTVRFGRLSSRRAAVCDEHLAIIDAIERGDGAAAEQAMQRHIDEVRAVVLQRLGAGR